MSVQTQIDRITGEVADQANLIDQILAALEGKAAGAPGATAPALQSKSVTPTETEQTVTPDGGYYGLSSVSVGAISKTYVGSDVTKKTAATYTPGTSDQAITSGQYLTGVQTIKGDANLLAENIKSGVSIFDVLGTFEGESGGDGGAGSQPDGGTGGLPDGIAAIASGTITPASDITKSYTITHDLGVIPDFAFLMLCNDAATTLLPSMQVMQAQFCKSILDGNEIIYTVRGHVVYLNNSGVLSPANYSATTNTYSTTSTLKFNASTSYPMKAGYTYRWVCGKLPDIQ